MAPVEMILSATFVAVPALSRVEPGKTSGPVSNAMVIPAICGAAGLQHSRTVAALTGLDGSATEQALDAANGRIPVAVIMAKKGVDLAEAVRRLEKAGGLLRGVL